MFRPPIRERRGQVLQKIRPLLWGRGKPAKAALLRRVEREQLGEIRFLVKQAKMLEVAGVDSAAYARDVLGLDVATEESLRALAEDAEAELQSRARGILKDLRSTLARPLDPDLKATFLRATRSL